ncbi:hypothetical protein Fcan01_26781 [Folsomia candida]|uniref:RNA-directed DNA polymerase from mobile element jockey n=1 Tax=Folsomia candida TaxID=158441 RepID=A0A226D2E7_FOLCA|nr:hypothetical protein Fcan01_26781 [Folsomia candida]
MLSPWCPNWSRSTGSLLVNLSKTKVMVFRKGGRLKAGTKFSYGEESIEIVNEYVYLGVLFSQKGVFQKAAEMFKKKGIVALASVWKTLFQGKVTSWKSKIRLFESISLSCALYAVQIWGLRYVTKLEEMQAYFYKRLLGVERTVPGYLLRLETASPTFLLKVMKHTLAYWVKLICMDEDSYPKICFNALYKAWRDGSFIRQYNWVARLHTSLEKLGYGNFCHLDNIADIMADIPRILTRIIDTTRQEDVCNMQKSKRHGKYALMWDDELKPAKYLNFDLTYKQLSIIAQMRLNDGRVYHEKFRHVFNLQNSCTLCNLGEEETFQHFICACKIYPNRNRMGVHLNLSNWPQCLRFDNREKCLQLAEFLQLNLRTRRMMIEE